MAVEMTVEQVDALEAEWRAVNAQAMALYRKLRKLRRVRGAPSPEDQLRARAIRAEQVRLRRSEKAEESSRKKTALDALLAELRATGLSGTKLWETVAERVAPVTA